MKPARLNTSEVGKMKKLPFVEAADVEGEYRTPPRVSKLLLARKFGGVKNLGDLEKLG